LAEVNSNIARNSLENTSLLWHFGTKPDQSPLEDWKAFSEQMKGRDLQVIGKKQEFKESTIGLSPPK